MKGIRLIAIVLLVSLGLNGFVEGTLFVGNPLNPLVLRSEPVDPFVVRDFFLLAIITALLVFYGWKYYAELVILQGITFCTWNFVQMLILDQTGYPQYVFLGIELMLFALGVRLKLVSANYNSQRHG